MKYSIVIPVYNAENDIIRCLNSLENQNYEDFEIIIIDDGSIDHSLKKCMEFKKEHENLNMIIKSVKNGGPGAARNLGIKSACGEKILFVDADDVVDDSYFSVLEKYNQDEFDLLCFGIAHHHKDGTVYKFSELNYIKGEKIVNKFLNSYLENGDLNSSVNKCFDRNFLLSNNILFPEKSVVEEDLIFNLRAINVAKNIKTIPDILYHYLCKSCDSATTSYNPQKLESKRAAYIEEIKIANSWCNNQLIQLFQNNYLVYISASINNLFYKKCDLKKKEKLQKIEEWFSDEVTKTVIASVKCNTFRAFVMYYLIKYNCVRLSYFIHYLFNIGGRG